MLLPTGAYTFFFCPLSGSGAVAQSSPICTNRLFEAGQLRRERTGSAKGSAQLNETKPICSGRTKRPMKRRFSFVPGAARFLLPRQKKMWGVFLHAGSGVTTCPGGTPKHPGTGIGRTSLPILPQTPSKTLDPNSPSNRYEILSPSAARAGTSAPDWE